MATKIKPSRANRGEKDPPPPPCTRQRSRYHSDSGDNDNGELASEMTKLRQKFNGESKNIAKLLQSFQSDQFNQLQKRIDGLNKKKGEQVGSVVKDAEILEVFQTENKTNTTYPLIVKMRGNDLKVKCMHFRK